MVVVLQCLEGSLVLGDSLLRFLRLWTLLIADSLIPPNYYGYPGAFLLVLLSSVLLLLILVLVY